LKLHKPPNVNRIPETGVEPDNFTVLIVVHICSIQITPLHMNLKQHFINFLKSGSSKNKLIHGKK